MVAIKKQRDAEKKFAREIFDIEQDFARKHNATQIDLLLDRTKREMDLQKDLFDNAIRLTKQEGKDFDKELKRRTQARKVAGEAVRLTGQTSPIGGAVGIPGSPAALAAAERAQRIKSAQGSALIGGAFPLLFGQGLGAAGGGALGGFGGGMIGGEFGFGLSLIGTQLGSIIDEFVSKINGLAGSLESTESIFSGLEAAGFKVNDVTKELAASYEEAGLFADAYQLAIDELNSKLGDDGAAKLQAYQDELDRMNGLFEDMTSDLIAETLPALTGTVRLILGLKSAFDILAESPIFKILRGVGQVAPYAIPGLLLARGQFELVKMLGAADDDVRTPDSVNRKQEAFIGAQLASEVKRNQIAIERGYIVDRQLELAKTGNDILSRDVQLARERLIDERYNAAVRKEGVTDGEKALAGKERQVALQKLVNEITKAETAEQERQQRIQEKSNRKAELERKKAERKELKEFLVLNKEITHDLDRRDEINAMEGKHIARQVNAANQIAQQQDARKAKLEGIINGTEREAALKQRISDIEQKELLPADKARLIAAEKQIDAMERQAEAAEKIKAQFEQVGKTVKSGIVDGIMAAIDGTKSLQESLASILRSVGRIFLNAAISKAGSALKIPGFADGGYVSGPTAAVVGEGGEPEYIIPESKMRESMSRYSRGARGGSVIPENGGGGSVMDGGGGTAVAAPIDVRYTVERINSVDYVTADQFQQGLQQAANQGAKQGEQQTLKRLQMSSSTRKRIGM
jgi:hypothetical protein